jgi:hypothetical protein
MLAMTCDGLLSQISRSINTGRRMAIETDVEIDTDE